MIGAAAIMVTLGTYVAMGSAFVRFGILHHLFVASILGLLFLNLPFWIGAVIGAVFLALPYMEIWLLWGSSIWLWLGEIRAILLPMVDYIPLMPWFGMFLLGIAFAQLLARVVAWPKVAALMSSDPKWVLFCLGPGSTVLSSTCFTNLFYSAAFLRCAH